MWKCFNRIIYRVFFVLRALRLRCKSGRVQLVPTPGGKDEAPILYVAWGRIGDLLLATGHLKHLQKWFGTRPVWLLGRPEIETIVAPYCAEFIPFDEAEFLAGGKGRDELLGRLGRQFQLVIADIHTFYGGVFVLGKLLEQLAARQKFIYEGYYLGAELVPWRIYPAGFEVVQRWPGEAVAGGLTSHHILHHMVFYIGEVLRRAGVEHDPLNDLKPELVSVPADGGEVCRKFGLEPGKYVAWQPVSNNPKKDYPLDRWFTVLGEFPAEKFVALGTGREGAKLAGQSATNVENLCGQTTLAETIQLIRHSRFFLGLDSGLSHLATLTGGPTLCVAQNNNLGWFFPYPPASGFPNQITVYNDDYRHCSGCFMLCRYESVMATRRKGALCLRTLPVEKVVIGIAGMLESLKGEVGAKGCAE